MLLIIRGLRRRRTTTKKEQRDCVALFLYWVGESNSYCKIENLEY